MSQPGNDGKIAQYTTRQWALFGVAFAVIGVFAMVVAHSVPFTAALGVLAVVSFVQCYRASRMKPPE